MATAFAPEKPPLGQKMPWPPSRLAKRRLSTRMHREKCRRAVRLASGAPVFANGAVTAAMGYAFNQMQQNPHDYGSQQWAEWEAERSRGRSAIQLDPDDDMSWNVMPSDTAASYRAGGRRQAELVHHGTDMRDVLRVAPYVLGLKGGIAYAGGRLVAGQFLMRSGTVAGGASLVVDPSLESAVMFSGSEAAVIYAPPPLKGPVAIGVGVGGLTYEAFSSPPQCSPPLRC